MNLKFPALRVAAGLSQQDAADLLGVRLDTVKQWSSGRRSAPPNVLSRLKALLAAQEEEVARLAASFRTGVIEFERALADSDDEARALGWPSAAVYNVIVARAWAAQLRLSRKFTRLDARKTNRKIVVTAIARELAGFVWAEMTAA